MSNVAKQSTEASEQHECPFGFITDVVPTTDGGAYAYSFDGMWYLRGTEAVRVREVERFSVSVGQASSQPVAGWPTMAISQARKARRRAEEQQADSDKFKNAPWPGE